MKSSDEDAKQLLNDPNIPLDKMAELMNRLLPNEDCCSTLGYDIQKITTTTDTSGHNFKLQDAKEFKRTKLYL